MAQVEQKTCRDCGGGFQVSSEDVSFHERIDVPSPDVCPECRAMRRLAFWPFGKFHKRNCDLTGEKIISIFPPDARFPVYRTANWYSDKWEPPSLDYDPSRSFFDQLYELQNKTPRPHQFGANNTNCDYSDDVWESRNCYLCRSFIHGENISYSYRFVRCRDSYDLMYCYDTEQSYDCIYCFKIFNIKHAFDVRDSFDSAFLYDCRNVRNCFMCWNLRNKEYHIRNKPYSKENYFKELESYNLGSRKEFNRLKKEFGSLVRDEAFHRANLNIRTTNSTGNYISDCKNCRECYFLENSEDCSYMIRGLENKICHDSNGIWRGEIVYNVCQLTFGHNLKNSSYCTNCRDSEYLDFCVDCESCFGCVGLRKKRFCVLNKQYSEEEYNRLIPEIRERMRKEEAYGQFFPYRMAYTGYNLSMANIYFPRSSEEVEDLGSWWEELERPNLSGLDLYEKVDDIKEIEDDVLQKALICSKTGRPFNVTKDELQFLRNHSIPLPEEYPDVRTTRRMKDVFMIERNQTECGACGRNITSYRPKGKGYRKIFCEECYQAEIF